jgi:hypothetical protein
MSIQAEAVRQAERRRPGATAARRETALADFIIEVPVLRAERLTDRFAIRRALYH